MAEYTILDPSTVVAFHGEIEKSLHANLAMTNFADVHRDLRD